MYCRPTCSYSTTPTFSTLGFSSTSPPPAGSTETRPAGLCLTKIRTRASVCRPDSPRQAGLWYHPPDPCLTKIAPGGGGLGMKTRERRGLWSSVREELAQRMATGKMPPGYQLPPEPELATDFGVSRATLREALRSLEEDGFLTRTRGAGTIGAPRVGWPERP